MSLLKMERSRIPPNEFTKPTRKNKFSNPSKQSPNGKLMRKPNSQNVGTRYFDLTNPTAPKPSSKKLGTNPDPPILPLFLKGLHHTVRQCRFPSHSFCSRLTHSSHLITSLSSLSHSLSLEFQLQKRFCLLSQQIGLTRFDPRFLGEPVSTVLKADPVTGLSDQEVVSGKDEIPSDSKSMSALLDATSSIKGETDQVSVGEHGVYYPPTSCYNYYYPGYTGSFTQMDDHGYMHANSSHTGAQSDNGSMLYYLPSYNPYAPGTLMGMDGQGVGQQQYYPSSGYMQPHVSYGSEAAPYSWDSTFGGDVSTASNAGSGNVKAGPGSTALSRSNGFTSTKANGPLTSKFSKPLPQTQPGKSLNKVPHLGNDFSAGLLKGYPPAGRFSSYTNQKYGLFPPTGQTYYQSNGRILNGNDRFKSREKYNRNEDFESSAELTRGPRSRNKSSPLDSPIEKEELGITVRRDKYNLPDFQTDYEKAKFYVIKSYSEDDVHKSIKYDVWASTPNGNKKLDAAFHDSELKLRETNTQYPIFLFFSVNGSGQFVGVAEMIGQVDFNKDMDFWQVDKWSGFFPVKWHVIKDIPNPQLRHIILENNDNRPVTFTRDTQEIGHKQGLELLNIFKSYTAKTSLLDDFTFYENREKSLQAKRSNKPATLKMEDYDNGDITKHMNAGGRNIDVESGGMRMGSLISLTKNMNLNACP